MDVDTILFTDVMTGLRDIPDECINTVVTSPPYLWLRGYEIEPTLWPEITYAPMTGMDAVRIPGERCILGEEENPSAYVGHIVFVFREIRRVLKKNGTAWLNIGDSYACSGKAGKNKNYWKRHTEFRRRTGRHGERYGKSISRPQGGLKRKNLTGIPWRVALALQADGWYLRSDIIWQKPNMMPESVRDRPSKCHEYIFLLSKNHRYYYNGDAIREQCVGSENANGFRGECYVHGSVDNATMGKRKTRGNKKVPSGWDTTPESHGSIHKHGRGSPKYNKASAPPSATAMSESLQKTRKNGGSHDNPFGPTRNKRTVWTIATRPYKGAHYSTFPPALIEPCILAGCPPGGTVLDPFIGSGTVTEVAIKHGMHFIGIEAGKQNAGLINKRIRDALAAAEKRKEEERIKELQLQLPVDI